MRKYFLLTIFLPQLIFAASCSGHFVNPFTDICWDCLFPISIGKTEVVPGAYPDTSNPSSLLCSCRNNPIPVGMAIGFWEPFSLVDVTPEPYCMVNLGLKLDIGSLGRGGRQMPDAEGRSAFYHVHWYKYPLIYWLQLIGSTACMQVDEFDVAYLTELDPTWNDSTLAFILNPEATIFSNPIARGSCAIDASKTIAGRFLPVDSLFWCQGSQGSTYPLSGHVAHQSSPIQAATLLAERMNFKMHREGLVWDSVGLNSPALCYTYPMPVMPKSRYRYQMVNTIAEGSQCHPFGQTTAAWETGHINPADGGNYGFLIWKKRNCCFL